MTGRSFVSLISFSMKIEHLVEHVPANERPDAKWHVAEDLIHRLRYLVSIGAIPTPANSRWKIRRRYQGRRGFPAFDMVHQNPNDGFPLLCKPAQTIIQRLFGVQVEIEMTNGINLDEFQATRQPRHFDHNF